MLTFTPLTLLISFYFAAESFNFLWNHDKIPYNTTTRYFWKLRFSIITIFASAGIKPGSIASKATMLTFTPPTLLLKLYFTSERFNFLWNDDEILYNTTTRYFWKLKFFIIKKHASSGNQTRIYCLDSNNANLYTTDPVNITLLCSREF